jgi:hypothetical protein
MKNLLTTSAVVTVLATLSTTVQAQDDIELVKCEQSFGTIAVVDGDTQGWAEYNLGSPRESINSLAMELGCFTPVSPASNEPAAR